MVDNTRFMNQLLSTMQNIEKAVSGGATSGTGYASINTDLRSVLSAAQQLRQETNGAADGVNRFVASLDQTAVKFREQGKMVGLLSTTFDQLDKASGRIMSKIGDKTGVNKVVKSFKEGGKALKEWGTALIKAENGVSRIFTMVDGFTSLLGKGVGLIGSIAGGFLSLGKVLTNSVVSILGNALTMAGKFAEFAITLPIDIANKASELGGKIREELVETIQSAVEKTKDLFDTASNSGDAFTKLGSIAKGSLLSFQSVGSTMTKLFGYGAQGAANMVSIISGKISEMGVFSEVFAKSTTNSGKSIEFLQRMTEGLGMKGADLNYVVAEAMKNGEHYFETLTRMKESMDTVSTEFGVNRKRLSMNFFELRKDITQFGHLTDIQLQRTAASAMQLGIEMKDVAGVFNKFSTFEDAANSAALLQQTFGMNIDALQLIRAENPMEIIEMFRQSMLMTGRSFDDLNRHEKALMAQHTGMSVEALKQIMNYRTLGKSYEDIKKIMNDQKPEERQIRAMKDMKTSMAEIQKIMNKKDFFEAFLDGFSKTIMYGTEFGSAMVDINKAMQDFYENGLKLDKDTKKVLNTIFKPFTGILNEIKDIFSTASLSSLKTKILATLSSFIEDVTTPDIYFTGDLTAKWNAKFASLFDLGALVESDSFLGRLAKVTGTLTKYFLKGFVAIGPALVRTIGDALLSVTSFLKDPSKFLEGGVSDNIAKFLGMTPDDFSKFKLDMAAALNDIKAYLFGGTTLFAENDSGFTFTFETEEKGLFNQLFGDFTGVDGVFATLGEKLKVTIKSAFDIAEEDDIFTSIGQKIMAGIASATEHITTLVGTIMDGIKDWLAKNDLGIPGMGGGKKPNKINTKGGAEFSTGIKSDSAFETGYKALTGDVGGALLGIGDASEAEDGFWESTYDSVRRGLTATLIEAPKGIMNSAKAMVGNGLQTAGVFLADKVPNFAKGLTEKIFDKGSSLISSAGSVTSKLLSGAVGFAVEAVGASNNIQGASATLGVLVQQGLLTEDQADKIIKNATYEQIVNSVVSQGTGLAAASALTLGTGFTGVLASGATHGVTSLAASEFMDTVGYATAQNASQEMAAKMGISKDQYKAAVAQANRMAAGQKVTEDMRSSGASFEVAGIGGKNFNMSAAANQSDLNIQSLPDNHPLKQLALLTGNQSLDKKDIDELKERLADGDKKAIELMKALNEHFANNQQQVIVTVDGYALGAHLTTVQRQQAANRSLSTGTDTSAMASNSASLSTNGIG